MERHHRPHQVHGGGGGGSMFKSSSPSSDLNDTSNNYSSSSTSVSANHNHHHNRNHDSNDPMQSWWESVSRARSRIQSLLSFLPRISSSLRQQEEDEESTLSSLADSDRPARSLLESPAAYSAVSAALSSPLSGSGEDPLCHWLYDTYQCSDCDLRLVVLSFVPLLSGLYLSRIHASSSLEAPSPSLAGFEAVLLALYVSETKSRAGKPLMVSIPDLSQPCLYHTPTDQPNKIPKKQPTPPQQRQRFVGVLSPPLEPQLAVKSTKRGCIVGVALHCYHNHISQMPIWSKIEFCRFAVSWAGENCPCTLSLDAAASSATANLAIVDDDDNNAALSDNNSVEIQHMTERMGISVSTDDDTAIIRKTRIPLPWELLQPVLRIIGHCLLAPASSICNLQQNRDQQQQQELRDWAAVAARRLFARASHDLFPQGILATRSLIQLYNRAQASSRMASSLAVAISSSSSANTPKKPDVLLVSK